MSRTMTRGGSGVLIWAAGALWRVPPPGRLARGCSCGVATGALRSLDAPGEMPMLPGPKIDGTAGRRLSGDGVVRAPSVAPGAAGAAASDGRARAISRAEAK